MYIHLYINFFVQYTSILTHHDLQKIWNEDHDTNSNIVTRNQPELQADLIHLISFVMLCQINNHNIPS